MDNHQLYKLYPFLQENMAAWERLSRLWQRGASFLGTPLSLLGGAMTWVSDPALVSAISNAGGLGVLASGAMSPEMLEEVILETQKKTHFPFGVNLIVMHPQLEDMMQVCCCAGVSHVVFAGGLPTKEQIDTVRAAGSKVITFAPSFALGKRLVRNGVDALVIEGNEAGGHIGPVSTSILAQEILSEMRDVPVFAAGGIGHGSLFLSYLRMGAAGCQLGTGFVCAEESSAHPAFKQAFIRAQARDAIVSTQLDPRFPVIPVRALKNAGMQRFIEKQREVIARYDADTITLAEGQLEIEHFWAGALRRAVVEGDIENGSLMAGQSVGLVKRVEPVREIIASVLKTALADLV